MTKEEKKTQKVTAKAATAEEKTAKQEKAPTLDDLLKELIADDQEIKIVIKWEEVQPVYDRVLRAMAKTLKVDGFRPGKVPARIAEDRIRPDYLINQVTQQLLNGRLAKAVEESKIKPDADPNVMVTKAAKNIDWELTVALPQRTKIKLPDYKKFLQDKKKTARQELEKVQKEMIEKAKKEKKEAPKLLDEEQLKARTTDEALMALIQEIRPKVSRTLVMRGAQQEYENLVNRLGQYQITWADYLKNAGVNEQMLDQQFALKAVENLQVEFVLDALMDAEKITASDDEMKQQMKAVMPEVTSEEDQNNQLATPQVHDYLELVTRRHKLAQWLLDL